MKRFNCDCGNRLFFHNTHCLACQKEVSWCPACSTLTAFEVSEEGLSCARCKAGLLKCANRLNFEVCNRSVLAPENRGGELLCDCCIYNQTIPDLNEAGNLERWRELEKAKRQLFYGLNSLGLPHHPDKGDHSPGLSFHFKDDEASPKAFWRSIGKKERVFTGHDNGKITIHIREADTATREKLRVDLGEGHRTLIGHFRHEIGHYYWDLLVGPDEEMRKRFAGVFGDSGIDYGESLDRYYREGAQANWPDGFISAYATMHPWEDWAETFAFYLNIADVMETVNSSQLIQMPVAGDFRGLIELYARFGILMNELNRAMGLIDFLPAVIPPLVLEKLELVHDVVEKA